MLYVIFRAICVLVLRISGCKIKVAGSGYVPDKGPFILASNHLSNIDPVLLGTISKIKLSYMAKSELFSFPLFSWILKHSNAFPVKRNTADSAAIRRAVEILKGGRGLVVFPEGTRGAGLRDDFRVNRGIGFLARVAGVPIVPAYIKGSDSAMPKGSQRIRRAEIFVCFGEAIKADRQSGKSDLEVSRMVMDEIGKLKGNVPN